jgi:hypothetical protein
MGVVSDIVNLIYYQNMILFNAYKFGLLGYHVLIVI